MFENLVLALTIYQPVQFRRILHQTEESLVVQGEWYGKQVVFKFMGYCDECMIQNRLHVHKLGIGPRLFQVYRGSEISTLEPNREYEKAVYVMEYIPNYLSLRLSSA